MQVLVIYAGGIPSREPLSNEQVAERLKSYLELQLVATVEVVVLTQLAGADVGFDLAGKIGSVITKRYAEFDGFVVIHSIDNAIYTANLLTFQLTNVGKPVIFTGTTIPEQFFNFSGNFNAVEQISYREMSLRTSLVTSVQLATLNCAGVLLAYGPQIIQAVRAVENCTGEQTSFVAWPGGDIATVRFGIELNSQAPKRHDQVPQFDDRYSTAVIVLPRQPELSLQHMTKQTKAILLPTFQEQAVPSNLPLDQAIPLLTVGSPYAQPAPDQIIRLSPITPVAIHMKLLAAAGRYEQPDELVQYVQTNCIGEFGRL